MKDIFRKGDTLTYTRTVGQEDFARFESGLVHPVCSTFALARDMEWTTRQFVLQLRDEDEEGIGTMVEVRHVSPAFEGDVLEFTGEVESLEGNELICAVRVLCGSRLIATGRTGQKILKRSRIDRMMQKL